MPPSVPAQGAANDGSVTVKEAPAGPTPKEAVHEPQEEEIKK